MSVYRSGAAVRPRRGRRRRPGLRAQFIANAQASRPGWLAAVTCLAALLLLWAAGALWLVLR